MGTLLMVSSIAAISGSRQNADMIVRAKCRYACLSSCPTAAPSPLLDFLACPVPARNCRFLVLAAYNVRLYSDLTLLHQTQEPKWI